MKYLHHIAKEKSLAYKCPGLAKEWHPYKNGDLTPEMVSTGSERKVWWYLPFDVPNDYPVVKLRGKHFDFEWESRIFDRVGGAGCPYLSNQKVWKGFNDLATIAPKIARQWHPFMNKGLKDKYGNDISSPDKVTCGSSVRVWWIIYYDVPDDYCIPHLRRRSFDFVWKASPSDRMSGRGCPYLSTPFMALYSGWNDLKTRYPDIAAEWDYEKNATLPEKTTCSSRERVWWKRTYYDFVEHCYKTVTWQARVKARVDDWNDRHKVFHVKRDKTLCS